MPTGAALFDHDGKCGDSTGSDIDMSGPIDQIKAWQDEEKLSPEAAEHLEKWLSDEVYAAFEADIVSLISDENLDELEDAFRTQIAFGTGGIRGKMGAGPNRINLRTIGEAAQGLAQYVLESGPEAAAKGIAIANDTRNNSDVFAREVATIAAGNGVKAYLFKSPRATPELSYAVRALGATAGVVISASHNPPRDNGFKAYWSDGGQVVPPHDSAIIDQVNAIATIKRADIDEARSRGLIEPMPESMDENYLRDTSIRLSNNRNISIVFTPLHGVGATSIVPALENLGFHQITVIDKQNDFDGNFPTVAGGVANPEDPGAMTMAIQRAAEINADLVMASDPDADRLGCAVTLPDRGWDASPADLALNGNQIGVLLIHHLLSKGNRTDGVFAKTIVTTDLSADIARASGLDVVDNLLVGFKYIAQVIADQGNPARFVFGTEESHGYLATHTVRDKDAASAAMILADLAATLKAKGSSIRAYLDDIYAEHGYYREIQKSITREGATGNGDIQQIMSFLRESPPTEIAGRPLARVIDRQAGTSTDPHSGAVEPIDGDKGNVLAFTFTDAGNTRVTARPSGTEPKIKYYVSAASKDLKLDGTTLAETKTNVDKAAQDILDGMVTVAESALNG